MVRVGHGFRGFEGLELPVFRGEVLITERLMQQSQRQIRGGYGFDGQADSCSTRFKQFFAVAGFRGEGRWIPDRAERLATDGVR